MFRTPIIEFITAEKRFYFRENLKRFRSIAPKNPDIPQKIAKVGVTLAMN